MKRFFIFISLILLFVSCGHIKHRNLEEEFKLSMNGKLLKDNSNNYYMITYGIRPNSTVTIKEYHITKVDKNDVKAFFK